MIYEITLKKDSQDAFVGIRLDEDEYFGFLGFTDDGEEVYELETDRNLRQTLDQIEEVKSYRIYHA